MKIIPLHSLVLMVGPSGSGKSTLAAKKFKKYEIVSSDAIREEIFGDIGRQDINFQVFKEVEHRIHLKLNNGERVVVDATNLRKKDRTSIAEIGFNLGLPVFYIVVNRSIEEKLETQGWRESVPGLIEDHEEIFVSQERDIMRGDGIATVIDYRKEDFSVINKIPNGDITDHVQELGFKGVMVIGDVHGMKESLMGAIDWASARNLFMLFLGDVVDYGPNSVECVRLVHSLIVRGRAASLIGNHEKKIDRWFQQDRRGNVTLQISEGNRVTIDAVQNLEYKERRKFEILFNGYLQLSKHHVILENIIFAHAAVEPELFNMSVHRLHGSLESIVLYGELDEVEKFNSDGYPNRVYNWVDRIPSGKTAIVGHDIRSREAPLHVNGASGGSAIFLDTGSGKGGTLTTAHVIKDDGRFVVKAYTRH